MHNLTERQIQILKALIEEYIETAEPVASGSLEKKYDLGVSPATIRNEMAHLVEEEYLKQPHPSAGRAPTSKALKLYIKEIMQPEELSVAEEVAFKEKVWDVRHKLDRLLREATRTLASTTHMLSLAAVGNKNFYYAGTGYILNMPEFYDIDITRNLLMMLDKFDHWEDIFTRMTADEPINILFGPDLRKQIYAPYCFVFSSYKLKGGEEGYIGVVGPKRLPYRRIIPMVSYCARLLEEVALM